MLKCSEGCYPACDYCIFYDFNGNEEGHYTGHGVCWHPDHPQRKDPVDFCQDFICYQTLEEVMQ